jgi:hypothetical protein
LSPGRKNWGRRRSFSPAVRLGFAHPAIDGATFVHTDPNPANLIVTPYGVRAGDCQTSQVPLRMRRRLRSSFSSRQASMRSGRRIAKTYGWPAWRGSQSFWVA